MSPDQAGRIPGDHLYWGVIPATAVRRGQVDRYALERWLPDDVDGLHLVTTPLPGGDHLAIAIPPARLRQFIDQAAAEWWSLVPAAVPPHLAERAGTAAERLNLLVGPFEPARRRRLRVMASVVVLAGALLAVVLIGVGAERRRAWSLAQAADLQRSLAEATARVLPPVPGDDTPAALRIQGELRRLQAAAGGGPAFDAAWSAQRLLAAMPRDLQLQVEQLLVAPERLILRVRVPDLAGAERLYRGCTQVPGYRPEPLLAQQADGFALAIITLLPKEQP